jgi:uncharacterized protein YciW
MTDVIDAALEISPGDSIYELRRERPIVVEQLQRAHDALFADRPRPESQLTRSERAAAAYRVTSIAEASALAVHYLRLIDDPGVTDAVLEDTILDARLAAIIAHATKVTTRPTEATQDDLFALESAGLSVHDIVTLSQLIAFVNFQLRVVAGLDKMKG